MSSGHTIVVVGGGPAGVGAALGAKQQDAAAEVMLISDEHCEPYEKPPLSKAVLLGKAEPEHAPIAGPKGVASSGVMLTLGTRVAEVDRAARVVLTATGERIGYDALVLATGSINRELPMVPSGRNGVHYLRTEADARALRSRLVESRSLVIIGGGLIGLEVAASAAQLGLKVAVIEIAPRILARVCDPEISDIIHQRHRAHGVDIRVDAVARGLRDLPDGQVAVDVEGDTIAADLIVIGIGVVPDDRLAKAAGLPVQDGIMVDDHARTADPAIFAAGDCTRFPAPGTLVRLENWRHAQEHGAVAGRNAAGADLAYRVAPSFWSEQYDMYIQGVGWPVPQPTDRVRRTSGGATLLFELEGAHIASAMGINAQRDIAVVRRLIERRVATDAQALADPSKPLQALLRAG